MSPGDANQPIDPRTYFAAERTLLAWIRTGLAMMGFGFVVARFGLFLRELADIKSLPVHQRPGVSLWMGTTLVLLGVLVNVGAVLKHRQTVRRFERERADFGPLAFAGLDRFAAVSAVGPGGRDLFDSRFGSGDLVQCHGLNLGCHWLCQCSSLYTDQGKEFRRALAEPVAHDSEHKP